MLEKRAKEETGESTYQKRNPGTCKTKGCGTAPCVSCAKNLCPTRRLLAMSKSSDETKSCSRIL